MAIVDGGLHCAFKTRHLCIDAVGSGTSLRRPSVAFTQIKRNVAGLARVACLPFEFAAGFLVVAFSFYCDQARG